ncbi:MAG: hypothetical protein AB9844_03275 [Clostridiaceae bacterium]
MMKIKKTKSTIALFVAAAFIFIVGTALLVNNVLLYNDSVSQYVAQGYSIDTVVAYYLPSQLMPGVLEPIGTIYGVSFLLIAAAIINQKVSECLIFSKCGKAEDETKAEAEKEDEADIEEAGLKEAGAEAAGADEPELALTEEAPEEKTV